MNNDEREVEIQNALIGQDKEDEDENKYDRTKCKSRRNN